MRLVWEENTTVWWVPAIADRSAPTVAEIEAGEDLTSFVPKDGIQFGFSDNTVDIGAIDTSFDAQVMGSWGAGLTISFFRDDEDDLAWDTLPRRSVGNFVIRTNKASGAEPAASDDVMVFPVQTGQRIMNDSGANEKQRFSVTCAVTDTPDLDAAVAAG